MVSGIASIKPHLSERAMISYLPYWKTQRRGYHSVNSHYEIKEIKTLRKQWRMAWHRILTDIAKQESLHAPI